MTVPRGEGDPKFRMLLDELWGLHRKKGLGYGDREDTFRNVKGAEEWGVENWIGVMIRCEDKLRRLKNLAKEGSLPFEAARDAFIDLANYALIGLILYEEEEALIGDLGTEITDEELVEADRKLSEAEAWKLERDWKVEQHRREYAQHRYPPRGSLDQLSLF